VFVVFYGGGGVFLAFCRQEAEEKKRAEEASVTAVLETLFMTSSRSGNHVQLQWLVGRLQLFAPLILLRRNTLSLSRPP